MKKFNKLDEKGIVTEIVKIRKDLYDMQFDMQTGDLSDVGKYRNAKKELARALTILRERQLGIRKQVVEKTPTRKKTAKKTEKRKKETKTKVKKSKD